MSEKKRVSVNLNKKLQKTLLIASWARTPMEAINKVTNRYNYIISQEVQKLKEIFTDNELEYIAFFGTNHDWTLLEKISEQLLHIIAECDDIIFEVGNISKSQIEGKVRTLSVLQQIALVEYIEEYWFEVMDLTKLEKELQDNKIEEEVVDENVHSDVAALLNKIRENALKNSIL